MQIFDVIIFFELRTIQQKTVKPTYLCPLRKPAGGKKYFFMSGFELATFRLRVRRSTYKLFKILPDIAHVVNKTKTKQKQLCFQDCEDCRNTQIFLFSAGSQLRREGRS